MKPNDMRYSVIGIIGPVTGLLFGHVILALGMAKGVGSIEPAVVQSPNNQYKLRTLGMNRYRHGNHWLDNTISNSSKLEL